MQSCGQRRPATIGVIQMSPMSASRLGTVTAVEAIVRQDDRRGIEAREAARPLLLPYAYSGRAADVAALLGDD